MDRWSGVATGKVGHLGHVGLVELIFHADSNKPELIRAKAN